MANYGDGKLGCLWATNGFISGVITIDGKTTNIKLISKTRDNPKQPAYYIMENVVIKGKKSVKKQEEDLDDDDIDFSILDKLDLLDFK
jgi:hypothetical protein